MKYRLCVRIITALCLGLFWAGLVALVSLAQPVMRAYVPAVFVGATLVTGFYLCIVDGASEES